MLLKFYKYKGKKRIMYDLLDIANVELEVNEINNIKYNASRIFKSNLGGL